MNLLLKNLHMKEKMTIVNLDEEGWQCLYHGNVRISQGRQLDIYDVLRKKRQRQSMKISECETILNEVKFVKSHEEIIEKNRNRPKLIQPYIDRLNKYYKLKNNG